ncbi:MAG TPA: hypothetical protein VG847_04490 [Chitinophagaceae bacterium]|nr:hypothetical protein [Chitinophagaceae bacterium]
MKRSSFINSMVLNEPPPDISSYLRALWYDAKGNWDKAHHIVQDMDDKNAAWIHAYLHRKEGDISNADYWYHRAAKNRHTESLENEWKELVTAFASPD